MNIKPGTQRWWTIVAILSCSMRIRRVNKLPHGGLVIMTLDDVTRELQWIKKTLWRRLWCRLLWHNLKESDANLIPKELINALLEVEEGNARP